MELVIDLARLAMPTMGGDNTVDGFVVGGSPFEDVWGMLAIPTTGGDNDVVGFAVIDSPLGDVRGMFAFDVEILFVVADGSEDGGELCSSGGGTVPAADESVGFAAVEVPAVLGDTVVVVIVVVPDESAAVYTWFACFTADLPCLRARDPSSSMLSCDFMSSEFILIDSFSDVFQMYNKDQSSSRVGLRAKALLAALLTKLAGLIFRLFFLTLGG